MPISRLLCAQKLPANQYGQPVRIEYKGQNAQHVLTARNDQNARPDPQGPVAELLAKLVAQSSKI